MSSLKIQFKIKKILYITIMAILCLSTTLWFGCKEKDLPGSINGCITDKATGEPIKTAGVELLPTGIKTITGSEGQYEFNEIDPGVYKLHITKTGYEELVSNEILVNSNKATQSDVQIEKLPPSLRVINDNNEDIDELDFGMDEDDVMRSFSIFNDGTQKLQWQTTKTANWITNISQEYGDLLPGALQTIIITIDRTSLKLGENVTTLHITSNNGSRQLKLKAQGQIKDAYLMEDLNLMVQKNDIPGGEFTWEDAKFKCMESRVAGFSDWRMPTLGELQSICKSAISNFSPEYYWTATDFGPYSSFAVRMNECSGRSTDNSIKCKVRAVRTITE